MFSYSFYFGKHWRWQKIRTLLLPFRWSCGCGGAVQHTSPNGGGPWLHWKSMELKLQKNQDFKLKVALPDSADGWKPTYADRSTDRELPAPLHTLPAPLPCPAPNRYLLIGKNLWNFQRFMEFREPNYLTKRPDLFLAVSPRSLRDHLPVLARTILHHAPKGQPIRIKNTAPLHKVAPALANYLHFYSIRLLLHSLSPFYSVSLSPLCTSLPQGQTDWRPHSTTM